MEVWKKIVNGLVAGTILASCSPTNVDRNSRTSETKAVEPTQANPTPTRDPFENDLGIGESIVVREETGRWDYENNGVPAYRLLEKNTVIVLEGDYCQEGGVRLTDTGRVECVGLRRVIRSKESGQYQKESVSCIKVPGFVPLRCDIVSVFMVVNIDEERQSTPTPDKNSGDT